MLENVTEKLARSIDKLVPNSVVCVCVFFFLVVFPIVGTV